MRSSVGVSAAGRARLARWALAALGFCWLALPALGAQWELVDRIVAIVDRDVVTLSEAEEALGVAAIDDPDRAEAGLAGVVERLIEARLIEREVRRFTSEPVPEAQIDAQLDRLRSRFDDEAAFEAALASRGLSVALLRREIARQLGIARYLDRRFRALTYVTDEEVLRYFDDEIAPSLPVPRSPSDEELAQIERLLAERKFNDRVEAWIADLKARASIRRYVW